MHRRKRHEYAPHLHELEVVQGVAYRPMIWSAFGRVHPETQALLNTMAVQAARRRGLRDHRLVLRRICSAVGVALARRAARMVHSCVPGLGAEEEAGVIAALLAAGWPELRRVEFFEGSADVPCMAAAGLPQAVAGAAVEAAAQLAAAGTARPAASGGGAAAAEEAAGASMG